MTGSRPPYTDTCGLTLVETLVSTALIAIVMVLATNTIILFFDADRTATNEVQVEGVGRDLLTHIVESSRDGFIDYDYYAALPLAVQQEQIAFRGLDAQQTAYWFYNEALYICVVGADDSCPHSGDPSVDPQWDRLSPSDVQVVTDGVLIRPDVPPYIANGPTTSNMAPFVTVRFRIVGEGVESQLLQSSITPRLYAR